MFEQLENNLPTTKLLCTKIPLQIQSHIIIMTVIINTKTLNAAANGVVVKDQPQVVTFDNKLAIQPQKVLLYLIGTTLYQTVFKS